MRSLAVLFGLVVGSPAQADEAARIDDVRAEMAAALAAQADLQPSPVVLPSSVAPRRAAAASAGKRGIAPGAANDTARGAANQVSQRAQAQGASQAAAHQAQAAAAGAAGQAQSQAAKERARRPRR
jgi:hypothetical protein